MKFLLWIVAVASTLTVLSVCVDAQETDEGLAARVAPKQVNRLPASVMDATPEPAEVQLSVPSELKGASIEVGFSQDNEPEPHLLAFVDDDKVQLFQLKELPVAVDNKVAKTAAQPPAEGPVKQLPVSTFLKRISQAVDNERFFNASQPHPKPRCKDRYVVRIKAGNKFRERRGCTNQSDDPFAAFAQVFFRDAFVVWNK